MVVHHKKYTNWVCLSSISRSRSLLQLMWSIFWGNQKEETRHWAELVASARRKCMPVISNKHFINLEALTTYFRRCIDCAIKKHPYTLFCKKKSPCGKDSKSPSSSTLKSKTKVPKPSMESYFNYWNLFHQYITTSIKTSHITKNQDILLDTFGKKRWCWRTSQNFWSR